jgi:Na+-driven multidrug efflux pump
MWWIIGTILYLLVGKTIANILYDNDLIEVFEDMLWIPAVFFPIVLIFVFLSWIARGISDIFY